MKLAIKTCVFAVAFAAVTCVVNSGNAEAGNGWRWSKPMNQKAGHAFYTSNRRFKQNRGYSTRTYSQPYRSRAYVQPVYTAPIHQPQVVIPAPPSMYPMPLAQPVPQPGPTGQIMRAVPTVQSAKVPVTIQQTPAR